jgi:hypothetical protein
MLLKDNFIAIETIKCTIHVLQSMPTVAGWRDGMDFFLKNFNYLVGSTSPGIILHLTGLQKLPTDEFGYVQPSFKDDFIFPDNLQLEK